MRTKNILSVLQTSLILLLALFLPVSCTKDDQRHPSSVKNANIEQKTARQRFPEPPMAPNVFIIVADALRYDILGCYGGPAHTPHIDRLAKEGILFNNAYSTSPWTAPSSVSMFTGNYPTTYAYAPYGKTIRIQVPDQATLLPEILAGKGIATAMLVENPNASLHNSFQGYQRSLPLSVRKPIPPQDIVRWQGRFGPFLGEIHPWPRYNSVYQWAGHIMELPAGQRFFFVQWFLDPHAPYDAPPPFVGRTTSAFGNMPHDQKLYKRPLPMWRESFSATEIAYSKALYQAEVESVDERIGILMASLKHAGLFKDTLIIFTSDHGEQFGERGQTGHGGFGKGVSYYEPLVHVPLIMRGPGLPMGVKREGPVSLISLMSTVADFLGVSAAARSMQGESIAAFAAGSEKRPAQRPLFFTDVRENIQRDAVLFNGYKLIAVGDDDAELYDMKDDPHETRNLAVQQPGLVRKMRTLLTRFRQQNHERLARNKTLGQHPLPQSPEERKKTIHRLKELGYMK